VNDKFEKSKKITDSDLINPSIEYLKNIDFCYKLMYDEKINIKDFFEETL
jgi:hypothetical protein